MKTLYHGGTILTMEEPLYAEAVLVENGKIMAVGNKADITPREGEYEKVDLQGAVMLPGLIDPHSHFFQVAASLQQVSVDGAGSPEEMKKRIRAYLSENQVQPGQWVNVRDYDNNQMPGLKNPTLEQLDDFAPENPMIIHHKSGHMGLMNRLALNALQITADTPSPEGGRIEVKDGKLTGYMEENAFIHYLKLAPMPGPEQLLGAIDRAQQKYASYGITTVQDGMIVEQILPMYEMMLRQNSLYLDEFLYAGLDAYDKTRRLLDYYPDNQHLKLGGLKMFLDGSPQGRTAWMRSPYEGETDYTGYGTMTDAAVADAFRSAVRYDTQILAHCNGDAAAEQFLRCLEQVEAEAPQLAQLRPVIVHGQLMGRDQLPRAAKLGAMISFFVAHTYHWGDVHIRNFGMERASRISPARTAIREGVKITFHQDSPVIEPDMMETVWCAVNRITKNGVTLGEEERISTLDALKAITVNAAYQYGEEQNKGSIAPGKRADFAVLDRDPLQTEPMELRKIRVLCTYKDGKCIYSAK